MRSIIFTILCMLLVFFSLPGCTSPEDQHVKNGDYYFEQDDWTLAISEYEKALAINPEITVKDRLLDAYSNRAIEYINSYQWNNAIEDIEKLQVLYPDIELPVEMAGAYLGEAEQLIKDENWEEAKERSTAALEIDPDSIDANNNIGIILLTQGFYDRAIPYADKVIQMDDENKMAYMIKAESQINLGDLGSAMLDAEKLIELYPDAKEGYYYRGYINWLEDNFEAIIPDMDMVIVMDPLDANAYNMRGAAYSWYYEWKKAKEDYDKAIMLNPSFRLALLNRAKVYTNTRQLDLAIEDANKVIDLAAGVMDEMSIEAKTIITYCIHK